MYDPGFTLYGCKVLTSIENLDSVDKVTEEMREAAIVAYRELAMRKMRAELLLVSVRQVTAIPDCMFDLCESIAVVDVKGASFINRRNRNYP